MLSNTLVTNEVKDSAGSEVEFEQKQSEGMMREFAKVGEAPNAPHRLTIKHQETGTGTEKVRRSMFRFDKTVSGASGLPRVISFYSVAVIPEGDLATDTEVKNVVAEGLSFLSSTGADTTIKFDCSGNGAKTLVSGTL